MKEIIRDSELILNKDNSIFHLHLRPEDIAKDIILVGDPNRVNIISKFFDKIELKVQNREFITHTGILNKKRLSVISTGIGTENIDIVINELDALVNINLNNRTIKDKKNSLNLIRIGTSGSLQKDIPVDSYLISENVIGIDGLINFYANRDHINNLHLEEAFKNHMHWNEHLPSPYAVEASKKLFNKLNNPSFKSGITITAPGFYGPQGRIIRLPIVDNLFNNKLENFNYKGKNITNFEMESSAIYGLSKLLGHNAVTICAIIANRITKQYSKDYKSIVEKLIKCILNMLTC